MTRQRAVLLAMAALLAACGPDARVESGSPKGGFADEADPQAAFQMMEETLLQTPRLDLRFVIEAEGVVSAGLTGDLLLEGDSVAQLEAHGSFAGDSVELFLRAFGSRMVGGSRARTFEQETPPHLREALVIGLTRMGLLHNLARLVGGTPPDRSDGTVGSWVEAKDFARLEESDFGAARFDIWVAGGRAAEAFLWFDENGLPGRREQTVHFPSGTMSVREEYRFR